LCRQRISGEFFGQMKRERVNRRYYATRQDARADISDYIERFYNPRKMRKVEHEKSTEAYFIKLSVKSG
jgi:putative transposase